VKIVQNIRSTIAMGAIFTYPDQDNTIGKCLSEAGEFARAEVDFLIEHFNEGEVFYDVGANIGTVCIPLARSRTGSKIYAFEPQLNLYQLLLRNITLNGVFIIDAFPWALGDFDGLVDFAVPIGDKPTNFGAVGRGTKDGVKTPVILRRLDSLSLPAPHILKIDVEGFDMDVVQGGATLIREQRPIVFAEANSSAKTVELCTVLLSWDYQVFWFFAPFVSHNNPKGLKVDGRSIRGDVNIAAFPSGRLPKWPLPKLDRPEEDWRARVSEFSYLGRYGFTP
jgi:FkbM family methyltransferase